MPVYPALSISPDAIHHIHQPENANTQPGLFTNLALGSLVDCLTQVLGATGYAPLPPIGLLAAAYK